MQFGRTLRQHEHELVLAGIVLASLVFRVHVSNECSLWVDEILTHTQVKQAWPLVLAGPTREHPPFMYVLVKAVVTVFGHSETSLRAVSLVFGCVLLVAGYWLCAELGMKPVRRLAVVASLAVAPFFMQHATEARHYALFAALGTTATAATLRLLREPTRLDVLAIFVLSAAGMAATHYFGLPYAVALFAVVLVAALPAWRRVPRGRRKLAAALLALALLVVCAWIGERALALAQFYARGNHGNSGTTEWPDLLRAILADFAFATDRWIRVPELVLAAAGVLLLGRALRGLGRLVPAALVFAPCLGALCITSGHFVAPRYLAPSWVLYHVAACAALFELGDQIERVAKHAPERLARALAWVPFLLPLGLRLAEYPDGYGTGEKDYRGFQRYFLQHFGPDTALVTYAFGERILSEYGVDRPAQALDHFRRVRGIHRYLVVEMHVAGAERHAKMESLIEHRMGVPVAVWRSLPLVDLPHTTYQAAVAARLVVFDDEGPERSASGTDPARPARVHGRRRERQTQPLEP